MGAEAYMERIAGILNEIRTRETGRIREAAGLMANSIMSDHVVYVFGSGHSVIPVMDVFPRYGSFVGFRPLLDPRLMWFNVVGPGGARELLWLERQEGYVANFLQSFDLRPRDTMWVFSHGGLNAAPVEAAAYARERGLPIVAVSSGDNYRRSGSVHSSGKKLGDLADVMIDTCVPPEDSLVHVDGLNVPVAAGSTVAATAIASAVVAEVAKLLAQSGSKPLTFVSPNAEGVDPEHNRRVFEEYQRREQER